MARSGGLYEGRSLPLTADINLINLVDVAFTLLVIFMITAPIMQGGVEIQVPRADVAPLPAAESIEVSVDGDGTIFIGEAQVTFEEFQTTIKDIWHARGRPPVYLKGDESVGYGQVMRVIAVLKNAEIETVGLVAEPEIRRRR